MIYVALLILINAFALTASASDMVSWHPQVFDYVYVNDTINETIEYSVTTLEHEPGINWTVDGEPVEGIEDGNTYYYMKTWDSTARGFHTVTFQGNSGNQTEFKWYVNVYEIGGTNDGSIFDVIGGMLEDRAIELRAWVFRHQLLNNNDTEEFTTRNARWLHDEISVHQMRRDALRSDFKNGSITFDQYAAATRQVQTETRYYMKLARKLAGIVRDELKNEEVSREFENYSYTKDDWDRR